MEFETLEEILSILAKNGRPDLIVETRKLYVKIKKVEEFAIIKESIGEHFGYTQDDEVMPMDVGRG